MAKKYLIVIIVPKTKNKNIELNSKKNSIFYEKKKSFVTLHQLMQYKKLTVCDDTIIISINY